MPKFHIPYVRRYLTPLWLEYMECDDPCDRAVEAAVHGLLDLSITLEAADQEAAIGEVERMFPGHVAVREGIKRI
jgi:hypothetical protein